MQHLIIHKTDLILMLLLLLTTLASCDLLFDSEVTHSFEMYYLEDKNLSFTEAEDINLRKLVLQKKPFITGEEIASFTVYYMSNNPIRSYQIQLADSLSGNFSEDVRPFVIVINGMRFCLAEYWPAFMSIIPKSIHMFRAFKNNFHIHPGDEHGNLKLKDPIIISTLKKLGVKIIYINIGGD